MQHIISGIVFQTLEDKYTFQSSKGILAADRRHAEDIARTILGGLENFLGDEKVLRMYIYTDMGNKLEVIL